MKLPKEDPRAYLLGKITGGDQSIGDKQEQIAIASITLENNGVYVLLKQKKLDDTSAESKTYPSPFLEGATGKKINYALFDIVGQGNVWRSSSNRSCF